MAEAAAASTAQQAQRAQRAAVQARAASAAAAAAALDVGLHSDRGLAGAAGRGRGLAQLSPMWQPSLRTPAPGALLL
jgi:hypothetical protein